MITTTQIIISILGSGVFSAIVSGCVNYFANRDHQTRQLKIEYVEKQLTFFYGPINFYCSQNKSIFNHMDLVEKKIKEAWPVNEFRAEDRDAAMTGYMKDSEKNWEYLRKIIENNEMILEILNKNWSLIDLQDGAIFENFQFQTIRLKTEFEKNFVSKFSHRLIHDLPQVNYYHEDFVTRVVAAFENKKKELENLRLK